MSTPIPFLITIDTEGDHLWSRPETITTDNARYLNRFQQLCQRYQLKPTYLTNWEMANCPVFNDFSAEQLRRQTAEVGMHLHAWNQPPLIPLTENDFRHQPFLIEYPDQVLRDKIACLTACLEDTFQIPMVSHRAGRWAFNDIYARALLEHNYRVDCSITPGISWSHMKGNPEGHGGSDYRDFQHAPYELDPDAISEHKESGLLEVPMTIWTQPTSWFSGSVRKSVTSLHARLGPRLVNRFLPVTHWLRPNRRNRSNMCRLLDLARRECWSHVEFMLHSSELMPGGSPRFQTDRHIEQLYDDLEALFTFAAKGFTGMTLAEFAVIHRVQDHSAALNQQ
ncbi:MAG: deacetylase [Planctomycetota bacterium]|nr:deacetylase [Planctomycetota bacterium]